MCASLVCSRVSDVQERILVLSHAALWRLDFDHFSRVDHYSRTPLEDISGLRRKGDKGGVVIALRRRDGRPNPFADLLRDGADRGARSLGAAVRALRRGSERVSPITVDVVAAAGAAGDGAAGAGAPPFQRQYCAVPPLDLPAAPVRDVLLAAVDAAWRLHMASSSKMGARAPSPLSHARQVCELE